MKKLILIALLSVSNAFGGTISDNLANLASDPNVIIFVKGQRVYPLINPEDKPGNHYLKAENVDTWAGFNVNDIPRFVGVHVKQSKPNDQHETFYNLIESIPDSHGGFLKLNCLLETVRKNPHLTKIVFRWTLENAKQFGIVVGHELMNVNPDHYMAYRAIVDDVAPEMANTFELGYVWLYPEYRDLVGVEVPTTDPNRFLSE